MSAGDMLLSYGNIPASTVAAAADALALAVAADIRIVRKDCHNHAYWTAGLACVLLVWLDVCLVLFGRAHMLVEVVASQAQPSARCPSIGSVSLKSPAHVRCMGCACIV